MSQPALIPPRQRPLCRLEDLADGQARGFGGAPGSFTGLFAVRQGDAFYVYLNSCPHIGVPLDWAPDQFLSTDGRHLVCATHGAEFEIATGECISGPCLGDRLEHVMIEIKDGIVFIDEDAGL